MGKFGSQKVRFSSLRAHGIKEIPEIAPGLISATVGQNGANRKADVLTVQKLLVIIGRSSGTQNAKLAIDGIVGDRTVAAIKRYQVSNFAASDGLVEPGKYTIRALALGAKAVNVWRRGAQVRGLGNAANITEDNPDMPLPEPIQASNAEQARANRAFKGIPDMLKMVRKAQNVVGRAQMALKAQQGGGMRVGQQDMLSLTLMHKHFSKDTEAEAELAPHFGFVLACYKRIEIELIRRAASPMERGFFVGVDKFKLKTLEDSQTKYIAESTPGGAFGETTDAPFGVFLGPVVDTAPALQKPQSLNHTLVHEMWHWTNHQADQERGEKDSDHDELYPSNHRYADMQTFTRLRTADCFANFACEATFGTDVLRAFRKDIRLEHARRPRVDSNGFISP